MIACVDEAAFYLLPGVVRASWRYAILESLADSQASVGDERHNDHRATRHYDTTAFDDRQRQ